MTRDTATINPITVSKLNARVRRPKVVDDRRVCMEQRCDTVLSRYNARDRCHAHREISFPRVRGAVGEM